MKIVFLSLIALLVSPTLGANSRIAFHGRMLPTEPEICPQINVICPSECIGLGEPFQVSRTIIGSDPHHQYKYHWAVSSGQITDGQGTATITVENYAGENPTATLTVDDETGGPDCHRSASCTLLFCERILPRRFDTFGRITRNAEAEHLKNFAVELDNLPSAQGYVLAFGRRGSDPTATTRRLDRIVRNLVSTRGIEAGRIVSVDGGFRDEFTVELWIVPPGASPPLASPNQ